MSSLSEAKMVIENEIKGIRQAECKLDKTFNKLVNSIFEADGRVVMCGMGKSGHIAKKIFATLVSTGTPSMFMHPAEAFHGDLGMIRQGDVFFAISNSGETSEVIQLLPFIKDNGNVLISMTGNPDSTLAKISDFHIDIGVEKEACPLNLAPTTSTTVSLIIGDAIAVALMKLSNFKEENFAKYHPGGSLGRKLLMTVEKFIKNVKFVSPEESLIKILTEMASSKAGLVLVGSPSNLEGVITDGDVRKVLSEAIDFEYKNINAEELMSRNPVSVSANTKCGDADFKMVEAGVNSLVVKNNEVVIGIYDNLNRKMK